MERKLKFNTIYKHFKGNLYLVLDVVTDSESGRDMVLYKALYDDLKLYVRPIDMFLSEVDHDKYPDIKQKYRFEEYKIERK